MQRRARTVPTALLGCAVLGLAACGSGAGTSPEGAPPSGAATQRQLQAPPDVVGGHTDEDLDLEAPLPVPSWDEAARADALDTAERAMRAFARPGEDAATWWSELEPLLTHAAAVAYEGTDPANVPASAVTGAASLEDESTPYLAPVSVATDAGVYVVLLVREGAGAPWLVERLTPPAGVGS